MTSPGAAAPGKRHGPPVAPHPRRAAARRRDACPRSPRRCRRARASPSRRCRCCSRRSTRSSSGRSCVLLPDDADARDAGRGGRVVPRRGERRALPLARRALGLRPRAAAAPRRRAGPRARRARARRARLLVGARARRARCRRRTRGPRRSRSRAATSPGSTCSPRSSSRAGYERVERVEERGQFAVRGGLVDVFPTTGREPLRIELFGDEIEGIRAFSPFTQRALREIESATIYPAGERRGELVEVDARRRRGSVRPPGARSGRPRAAARPRRPTSSGSPTRCARSGPRRVCAELSLDGATELDPLPQGQPFSFDAQRPALAARGLSEAENELGGLLRQGLDVVVAFAAPRRGASASGTCCGASRPTMLEPGDEPAGPRRSRSRRRAAASSGATSASRCSPTRRSSAAGRRARRRRPAARSRASPTCARATTSCTRTTASRSCSASRRRRSRASPATTCCSPSAATTASSSRTSRSARSRATSAPTRRRRRSRSSAARPGTT